MARPLSFGKIDVSLTAGQGQPSGPPDEDSPFRVAILGDFSGRSSRGVRETGPRLANRKPLRLDRDNFEEVMARLEVRVELPVPGKSEGRITIPFRELEDFHPDRVYAQVEVFESLRQTRAGLNNPSTFAATAARVGSWAKPEPPASRAEPSAPPLAGMTGSGLLEQLLGESPREPGPRRGPGGVSLEAVLQDIVAPYLVPGADPRQEELVAQVDEATTGLMRGILHHPDFQALEAGWRALYFLIRRLDTDGPLQLYVLDVSREELAEDLGAAEDLASTGLYRLLVERTVGTPGEIPWALLTGNYTFGSGRADVELLGRLARIAHAAGAPLLAGASADILGCRSLAETPDPRDWQPDPEGQETWQALRELPEAAALGLALPRFLLRPPYGSESSPVEAFPFEELPPAASPHEALVWGNPAFAWTYLLGKTFNVQGWGMRPGTFADVEGLPLHFVERDGDKEQTPCGEAWLTLRAAEAILERGLIPLLSVRGKDSVRLGGFRSIASPPRPLAGRW